MGSDCEFFDFSQSCVGFTLISLLKLKNTDVVTDGVKPSHIQSPAYPSVSGRSELFQRSGRWTISIPLISCLSLNV